jgi:hypothetical protein
MKESLSRGRVVALASYTLRTKTGNLRVEDDGHGWGPGEALPPRDVKANAALALCRHAEACERHEREQARGRRAA